MKSNQKVYGYSYPQMRRDQEMLRVIETNNKALGKIGFCVGILGLGGYILYRKVSDLSKEVKKIKEETGK